ncbi:MAG: flagellar basal body P-ring protein FlgI [Firmicutes bacterium]|nr:flagellar basal body P-ring protein FlgI [Bacillota bacterium]
MRRRIWAAVLLFVLAAASQVWAQTPTVRVKDIARVHGVRDNQIYGLGLVVGLQGTGDSSGARANVQMIANMLEGFGITVSASDLRLRNIAAVMVTADIPSSVRTGDRIDVTVSSIGDARSLQGGFLLQTPLQAANGRIYAVAQGPLSTGGAGGRSGGGGSSQTHTTVAVIPNGAIVEQEIESSVTANNILSIVLNEPDFTTAARLESVINQVYGGQTARAVDQATIELAVPLAFRSNVVGFIAQIEELPIQPDTNARVVINERTGTVVMGSAVRIAPVAVSHGGIRIQVQPAVQWDEEGFPVVENEIVHNTAVLSSGANVQNLVDALNALGVSPRDIIAILQAVKAAGALFGELIII